MGWFGQPQELRAAPRYCLSDGAKNRAARGYGIFYGFPDATSSAVLSISPPGNLSITELRIRSIRRCLSTVRFSERTPSAGRYESKLLRDLRPQLSSPIHADVQRHAAARSRAFLVAGSRIHWQPSASACSSVTPSITPMRLPCLPSNTFFAAITTPRFNYPRESALLLPPRIFYTTMP